MLSSLAFAGGNNQFIVVVIINTQGNPLFARGNVIYFPKILKILDYSIPENYVKLKELPEMPHFRCLQEGGFLGGSSGFLSRTQRGSLRLRMLFGRVEITSAPKNERFGQTSVCLQVPHDN